MKVCFRIGTVISGLGVFVWTITPQSSPDFRAGVTVVNVPCVVRDHHGGVVTDLNKDDFDLFDGGKKQEIRYFARLADVPLAVGLLLDTSGSVRDIVQHEKETAADFLQQILRPSDAGMVVSFADSVSLWQDFTASVDSLRIALTKVRPVLGPPPFEFNARQGGTVLYDAIYVTATEKFRNRTGSKLLIVLSDGLDTNSSVTLETAIKSAQAMEVVVYGICNRDPAHQELEAYKRLHQPDAIRYSTGCDALKAIAEPTGGRMFEEGKNSNIKDVFDAIREEILGQYLLGFSPSNPAREGRFRTLDVKTKRRNLIVQARKGYYTFKRDEQ